MLLRQASYISFLEPQWLSGILGGSKCGSTLPTIKHSTNVLLTASIFRGALAGADKLFRDSGFEIFLGNAILWHVWIWPETSQFWRTCGRSISLLQKFATLVLKSRPYLFSAQNGNTKMYGPPGGWGLDCDPSPQPLPCWSAPMTAFFISSGSKAGWSPKNCACWPSLLPDNVWPGGEIHEAAQSQMCGPNLAVPGFTHIFQDLSHYKKSTTINIILLVYVWLSIFPLYWRSQDGK